MMKPFEDYLQKKEVFLQIALLILAALFLCGNINRSLVDYDEATYAKVIVDTIHSGNFLTLQLHEAPWFEKPPLYLWLAIGSVRAFGEHEFAFRLPSIIASILCCLLVYLIIRQLTNNLTAATIGFFALLFSDSFFVYAREARLDSSVTAAMLAVLLFYLKGWRQEKFLFWIFPLIALGFLLKSVIVLLIIPIVILYSLSYKQWAYVKSKFLWVGFIVSLAIVAPWHIAESVQFGSAFWDSYIGRQVFQRAVTTLTGTNSWEDYFKVLLFRYFPWNLAFVVVVSILAFFHKRYHWKPVVRDISTPLISALFIVILLTFARTHITSYILPAFPFFAVALSIAWYYLASLLPQYRYVVASSAVVVVIMGLFFCLSFKEELFPSYTYEEKAMGELFKAQKTAGTPLYQLEFVPVETINYYGDTQSQVLDPCTIKGKVFKGPLFLITMPLAAAYFFYNSNANSPINPALKAVYVGHDFAMIYSSKDLQMPMFSCNI
jgi:4-amino-4-deoxy-L-arabinose transferase-like glycosyltransferase